jgi:hypothetical protein
VTLSNGLPAGSLLGEETACAHSRAAAQLPFVVVDELAKEPDHAILVLKVSEKRLTHLIVGGL